MAKTVTYKCCYYNNRHRAFNGLKGGSFVYGCCCKTVGYIYTSMAIHASTANMTSISYLDERVFTTWDAVGRFLHQLARDVDIQRLVEDGVVDQGTYAGRLVITVDDVQKLDMIVGADVYYANQLRPYVANIPEGPGVKFTFKNLLSRARVQQRMTDNTRLNSRHNV